MKKLRRTELDRLLLSNVCEIVFVRRRPERTMRKNILSRRMLCTNSYELLNSLNGKMSLNYKTPGPMKIDAVKHNVVVAWDIFMQSYRNISMEACFLINKIPADDRFWKYFDEVLYPMSASQKEMFMDDA